MKGYMCKIAWGYEAGRNQSGTTIYWSLDDLKREHDAVVTGGCGIVEVEVTLVHVLEETVPWTDKTIAEKWEWGAKRKRVKR